MTTPGAVELQFNSVEGLTFFLDRQPVAVADKVQLDLTAGAHQFTVLVNRAQRKQPLKAELQDVAGSMAQVQILSGK